MLASITIKNIVLIEQLVIDFKTGLCALTGETGAGKSILLDSLGLTLGARSNIGLIRKGQQKSSVTSVFQLRDDHPVLTFLQEHDIDAEPCLIFRRTLSQSGTSKCFINDQAVSASLMRQAADMIVEIHGQFDNQKLFNSAHHIDYLDDYGAYRSDLKKVSVAWKNWQIAGDKMRSLQQKTSLIHEEEEYLKESLHDLDALSPESGEEKKLTELRQNLKNSSNIIENANACSQKLEEMQNIGAEVWRYIQNIEHSSVEAQKAFERANAEIEETLSALQMLVSDVDGNNQSLEEIDDRLFALKKQARKHDCSIDQLVNKREEIAQALNEIENIDDLYAQSIKANEAAKEQYLKTAKLLSEKRKKSAKELEKKIMNELPALKLEKARFQVNSKEALEDKWSHRGIDKVEFLVATNPNSNLGPLNKIASGGELARLTLALKVVFADMGDITTLIFDEVDSGIGGATAAAVGDRLSKLAEYKQILVVTHSPQVAAKADNQWIVSKSGVKEIVTNITYLETQEKRQEEIARMLAGEEITVEARAAASKLLEKSAA